VGKKKFFTLLSGASVHAAPNAKVIPRKEFSDAITAAQVLERAYKEVDQYKEEVAIECEKLKVQAQQEGFQEGFVQWAGHMAELEAEMANVNKATEKMIIPVALKAAKKIVGREIELSESAIVDIVASKLKSVKQSKQVIVHVCPKDLQNVEKHRADLYAVFEKLESLSIRANEDVKPGGCIIETEAGIINAQLDKQWEILEQAFKSMMT
jgi:type III secretion protein L